MFSSFTPGHLTLTSVVLTMLFSTLTISELNNLKYRQETQKSKPSYVQHLHMETGHLKDHAQPDSAPGMIPSVTVSRLESRDNWPCFSDGGLYDVSFFSFHFPSFLLSLPPSFFSFYLSYKHSMQCWLGCSLLCSSG